MRQKLRDRIERLAGERPVWLAFMVFLFTALLVVPVSIPFWWADPGEFSMNVAAEAYGTLFDLLIIGWLLLWLNNLADRRQQKTRYREEIEDALGWRSPVASHRIVSNVRRLNRRGVTTGIELPEAYLDGASLEGVTLRDSNLWGAHLDEASLREADFTGSILAGASFLEADLESARFESADLRGARLREADMERAHFENADLRGADLEEADLQYATLNGIGLERSSLIGANLRGATLTDADLSRATAREATFTGAEMEGARLDRADFTGAQLRDADLRGASVAGAIFRAADLSGIRLTDEDVQNFGQVETLYEAAFDAALRERLKQAHPHLFRPPGEAASTEETDSGSEQASSGDTLAGSDPPVPAPREDHGAPDGERQGENGQAHHEQTQNGAARREASEDPAPEPQA